MQKVTCDRLAVYGSPDGTVCRVPVLPGVTPVSFTSYHGRARFLITVIDANDPRSDDDLIREAIAVMDADLAALAEEEA